MRCSLLLLAVPALAAPATSHSPLVERQSCSLQSSYSTVSNSKLPDPFTFANGNKVTTQADWTCRQQEISKIIQQFEMGTKPPKPSGLTASYSGGSLSITATDGGKSISFSVSIKLPSSGSKPYPAIIGYGGGSIPVPANVATINFNNDDIAAQNGGSSRGQGKFYTLYGSGHSAGALMAWAWAVSRIIDAIEATPSIGIDPKHIGVTGCSRNGKGAFVAGAFDDRIALTIPQESGAGGAACWRISDSEKSKGKNIQTAGQIIGENPWFGKAFDTYANNVNSIPHDHHMLAGLVAPRGLLVIENDIDWLGPVSTTGCMKAGRLIYKGAGVPNNMGVSVSSSHTHCSFPSSQQQYLTAYINKFLLGGTTDPGVVEQSIASVSMSDWVSWSVPTLS